MLAAQRGLTRRFLMCSGRRITTTISGRAVHCIATELLRNPGTCCEVACLRACTMITTNGAPPMRDARPWTCLVGSVNMAGTAKLGLACSGKREAASARIRVGAAALGVRSRGSTSGWVCTTSAKLRRVRQIWAIPVPCRGRSLIARAASCSGPRRELTCVCVCVPHTARGQHLRRQRPFPLRACGG